MTYIPITPFRRVVDDAVLEHQRHREAECPSHSVNKWEVLRELSVARKRFGLTDRELTLLQTLLSFHPSPELGAEDETPVVFPSNAAICERLNGIPCSTMRRQLSRLIHSGFVIRRDSPNGKRYARRYGDERVAFGFDLTPLLSRFQEICQVAEEVRQEKEVYQRLRQEVSLMKRDLKGLADYGRTQRPDLSLWDQCDDLWALVSRDLKRSLALDALEWWKVRLEELLVSARNSVDPMKSVKMSTSDAKSEQHHQNSYLNQQESEPFSEREGQGAIVDDANRESEHTETSEARMPNVPLGLVLSACAEFRTYVPDRIRHWHELVVAANIVRPMMGISPSVWDEAVDAMGPEEASVVIVAMLERFSEIKSPGGYLRSLARKAERGAFSSGPMIMALMRRAA